MTKIFYAKICNTIYGEYMAHVWYEQKYCYTKISNTKILQMKLMRITVLRYPSLYQQLLSQNILWDKNAVEFNNIKSYLPSRLGGHQQQKQVRFLMVHTSKRAWPLKIGGCGR